MQKKYRKMFCFFIMQVKKIVGMPQSCSHVFIELKDKIESIV